MDISNHNAAAQQSHFVRYDATGAIVEWGHMPIEGIAHLTAAKGWTYALGEGKADTHYVDVSTTPHVLRERQPNQARLDGMVLRDLPVGGALEVSGSAMEPQTHPITQADETMSFDHPGAYSVTVRAPRVMDQTFELTVA